MSMSEAPRALEPESKAAFAERLARIVAATAADLETGDSVIMTVRVRVDRVGFTGEREARYSIDRDLHAGHESKSFHVESGPVRLANG